MTSLSLEGWVPPFLARRANSLYDIVVVLNDAVALKLMGLPADGRSLVYAGQELNKALREFERMLYTPKEDLPPGSCYR